MQIGALARAVNCSVETVRYYEKVGLLPRPARAANGYRIYTDEHLKVLRLIRRARSLGFSQQQVRQLRRLATDKDSPCDDVWALTRQQLQLVGDKQQELDKVAKALEKLASACEQGDHTHCPVLEDLISG